jgi:hypothetical protein
LRALLERPSLNRFTAERDAAISDHVLPTSVSQLEARGLTISRRMVEVPGYKGCVARIAEYSLDAADRSKAQQLLQARARRE